MSTRAVRGCAEQLEERLLLNGAPFAVDALDAAGAGYTLVDPDTVVITHLSELVKRQAADLLTRAETERMVARLRDTHASLIDELIPAVLSYSDVQKVLQNLLAEGVHIRDMRTIIETLAEFTPQTQDPNDLTAQVRVALDTLGRERVIASSDCGFGTFTKREWVVEPVVWLKLKAIRQGADIASARLWGKKVA